jgi:serine/alanine racemase
MDQLIVDVTDINDVKQGDAAVLIGKSGANEISACEIAAQTGTIANEVLSRLGERLCRITAN